MNNNIVLITEIELNMAMSLTEFMNEAWQAAHGALDKLVVMDSYIKRIRREPGNDYNVDAMDGIQEMRNQAYKLIADVRLIHNTMLKKIENIES